MRDVTFIYKFDVTYSNMEQLIQKANEKEQIEALCTKHSLNHSLLGDFFILKMRGLNNQDVSRKLGVHRVTIQRYAFALREMKESEFELITKFVLKNILKEIGNEGIQEIKKNCENGFLGDMDEVQSKDK